MREAHMSIFSDQILFRLLLNINVLLLIRLTILILFYPL